MSQTHNLHPPPNGGWGRGRNITHLPSTIAALEGSIHDAQLRRDHGTVAWLSGMLAEIAPPASVIPLRIQQATALVEQRAFDGALHILKPLTDAAMNIASPTAGTPAAKGATGPAPNASHAKKGQTGASGKYENRDDNNEGATTSVAPVAPPAATTTDLDPFLQQVCGHLSAGSVDVSALQRLRHATRPQRCSGAPPTNHFHHSGGGRVFDNDENENDELRSPQSPALAAHRNIFGSGGDSGSFFRDLDPHDCSQYQHNDDDIDDVHHHHSTAGAAPPSAGGVGLDAASHEEEDLLCVWSEQEGHRGFVSMLQRLAGPDSVYCAAALRVAAMAAFGAGDLKTAVQFANAQLSRIELLESELLATASASPSASGLAAAIVAAYKAARENTTTTSSTTTAKSAAHHRHQTNENDANAYLPTIQHAIEDVHRQLRLDKVEPLLMLGRCAEGNADPEVAVEHYKHVLRIEPSCVSAMEALQGRHLLSPADQVDFILSLEFPAPLAALRSAYLMQIPTSVLPPTGTLMTGGVFGGVANEEEVGEGEEAYRDGSSGRHQTQQQNSRNTTTGKAQQQHPRCDLVVADVPTTSTTTARGSLVLPIAAEGDDWLSPSSERHYEALRHQQLQQQMQAHQQQQRMMSVSASQQQNNPASATTQPPSALAFSSSTSGGATTLRPAARGAYGHDSPAPHHHSQQQQQHPHAAPHEAAGGYAAKGGDFLSRSTLRDLSSIRRDASSAPPPTVQLTQQPAATTTTSQPPRPAMPIAGGGPHFPRENIDEDDNDNEDAADISASPHPATTTTTAGGCYSHHHFQAPASGAAVAGGLYEFACRALSLSSAYNATTGRAPSTAAVGGPSAGLRPGDSTHVYDASSTALLMGADDDQQQSTRAGNNNNPSQRRPSVGPTATATSQQQQQPPPSLFTMASVTPQSVRQLGIAGRQLHFSSSGSQAASTSGRFRHHHASSGAGPWQSQSPALDRNVLSFSSDARTASMMGIGGGGRGPSSAGSNTNTGAPLNPHFPLQPISVAGMFPSAGHQGQQVRSSSSASHHRQPSIGIQERESSQPTQPQRRSGSNQHHRGLEIVAEEEDHRRDDDYDNHHANNHGGIEASVGGMNVDGGSGEGAGGGGGPVPIDGVPMHVLLLRQARLEYARNHLTALQKTTEQLLLVSPHQRSAVTMHLLSLVESGNLWRLFDYGQTLQRTQTNSEVAVYAIGCYYYARNDFERAGRFFGIATELDPMFAEAWLAYGHCFSSLQESEGASTVYRRTMTFFPGLAEAHIFHGIQLMRTLNPGIARTSLTSARSIAPFDPLVLNELGVLAFRDQDLPTAREYFSEALALVAPGAALVVPRRLPAQSQQHQQQSPQSSLSFTKSNTHNAANGGDSGRNRRNGAGGASSAASKHLRQCKAITAAAQQACQSISAHHDCILFNLGLVHRREGDYDAALHFFGLYRDVCPRSAPVYCALGLTYHLMGAIKTAIEHYHSSLALQSDSFCLQVLARALQEEYNGQKPCGIFSAEVDNIHSCALGGDGGVEGDLSSEDEDDDNETGQNDLRRRRRDNDGHHRDHDDDDNDNSQSSNTQYQQQSTRNVPPTDLSATAAMVRARGGPPPTVPLRGSSLPRSVERSSYSPEMYTPMADPTSGTPMGTTLGAMGMGVPQKQHRPPRGGMAALDPGIGMLHGAGGAGGAFAGLHTHHHHHGHHHYGSGSYSAARDSADRVSAVPFDLESRANSHAPTTLGFGSGGSGHIPGGGGGRSASGATYFSGAGSTRGAGSDYAPSEARHFSQPFAGGSGGGVGGNGGLLSLGGDGHHPTMGTSSRHGSGSLGRIEGSIERSFQIPSPGTALRFTGSGSGRYGSAAGGVGGGGGDGPPSVGARTPHGHHHHPHGGSQHTHTLPATPAAGGGAYESGGGGGGSGGGSIFGRRASSSSQPMTTTDPLLTHSHHAATAAPPPIFFDPTTATTATPGGRLSAGGRPHSGSGIGGGLPPPGSGMRGSVGAAPLPLEGTAIRTAAHWYRSSGGSGGGGGVGSASQHHAPPPLGGHPQSYHHAYPYPSSSGSGHGDATPYASTSSSSGGYFSHAALHTAPPTPSAVGGTGGSRLSGHQAGPPLVRLSGGSGGGGVLRPLEALERDDDDDYASTPSTVVPSMQGRLSGGGGSGAGF